MQYRVIPSLPHCTELSVLGRNGTPEHRQPSDPVAQSNTLLLILLPHCWGILPKVIIINYQ